MGDSKRVEERPDDPHPVLTARSAFSIHLYEGMGFYCGHAVRNCRVPKLPPVIGANNDDDVENVDVEQRQQKTRN